MNGNLKKYMRNKMRKRRTGIAQMKFQTCFDSIESLVNFSRKIENGNFHFCSASTVARASRDIKLAEIISSGFAIADSTPLAFTLTGNRNATIRGTTFTRKFCETSVLGERVLLVGSTPLVLNLLKDKLQLLNSEIDLVGFYSPCFSDSVEVKVNQTSKILFECKPEFIFVALSSPQQDYFIDLLAREYPAKYFAVGAAFDFIAETKAEAPYWLQGTGFEWLFRLANEPRRLWKRYLIDNLIFCKLSLDYVVHRIWTRFKHVKK